MAQLVKLLIMRAWHPKFDPEYPHKKLEAVTLSCNPSSPMVM